VDQQSVNGVRIEAYFLRESLARLLALEKYQNLIETNITAGITLYTDHKPGLYENSLSNKGKLSAWRLLETAERPAINSGESLSHRGQNAASRSSFKVMRSERRFLRHISAEENQYVAGQSAAEGG
jgi:hypothetical protein